MADHSTPDYSLADRLDLDAGQLKVLLHPMRSHIIDLLTEAAATTSQLADALDKPKGTVGYHCKALEKVGLIRVVRTAKVRAIEERYYGRTARLFVMGDFAEAGVGPDDLLNEPLAQLRRSMDQPDRADRAHLATVRYARIPKERAEEWEARLIALADEFASQPRDGDVTYGLLAALFDTDRRPLA